MKTVNLKMWANTLKADMPQMDKTINEDFIHAFEWSYLEGKYILEFNIAFLNDLDSRGVVQYGDIKKAMIDYILNMLPLNQSTSQGSNRADVLKLNAVKRMLNNLVWYTDFSNNK